MFFIFFLCFSFFIFYSFIFLLFSFFKKRCKLFILFLFFSFLGRSKSVAALQDSLGKVHILSWLYLLCIGSSSSFPVEQCTFW